MGIAEEFQDRAGQGFADFHAGSLAAQDNPDFIAAYKELLSQNDRVLCLDLHTEDSAKEFMASEQHMRMLKEDGYEFHLIEYDPELNPSIEAYERGEISIDDLRDQVFEFAWDVAKNEENLDKLLSSGILTEEEAVAGLKSSIEPFVKAVENATLHDIKVRFFDDTSVIGNDTHDNDENSQIDNPILRRDDTWDPYIEALTKGAKASMFIGGGHAATSYGIDEYMEARGYNVGKFRISEEVSYAEDDVSIENNQMVSLFKDAHQYDQDGYDPSDFRVDLFYHDETKTIEWQEKKTRQEAEFKEPQIMQEGNPVLQIEAVEPKAPSGIPFSG